MEHKILTSTITEPVTAAECRGYIGYPTTDQDAAIEKMIITAREWLEGRTGLSLVSKQYEAYFEKCDTVGGWYELPFSPVLTSPAISVKVNGVAVDFEQKGLNRVRVRPYASFGTINVGSSGNTWYMNVTFQAGATSETANEILRRIVTTMFNCRDDGSEGVPVGRLPYDTLRLIETINQNTGL